MAEPESNLLWFNIGESGDVEWACYGDWPPLTNEQAMVIVQARGYAKVASALESLANAVSALADKLPYPEDR